MVQGDWNPGRTAFSAMWSFKGSSPLRSGIFDPPLTSDAVASFVSRWISFYATRPWASDIKFAPVRIICEESGSIRPENFPDSMFGVPVEASSNAADANPGGDDRVNAFAGFSCIPDMRTASEFLDAVDFEWKTDVSPNCGGIVCAFRPERRPQRLPWMNVQASEKPFRIWPADWSDDFSPDSSGEWTDRDFFMISRETAGAFGGGDLAYLDGGLDLALALLPDSALLALSRRIDDEWNGTHPCVDAARFGKFLEDNGLS